MTVAILLAVLFVVSFILIFVIKGWWKVIPIIIAILAAFFLILSWSALTPTTEEVVVAEATEVVVALATEEVVALATEEVADTPCVEAISVASQIHGGKVEANLNDGDPFDYSLTIVSPDFPTGDQTLVVLAEPGHIFDVTYPVMYFTSYRLRGTQEQALCSATALGGSALAYVYVGAAETPENWSTIEEIDGWWTELVHKEYSEAAITPGGEWSSYQIAGSDPNRAIVAISTTYGQLWNPAVGGVVVHFQIEVGSTLTIPAGWQGTYWTVVGGDHILIQSRFLQATREVIERDVLNLENVTLLFCGNDLPRTGLVVGENDTLFWISNLDGWTCTLP